MTAAPTGIAAMIAAQGPVGALTAALDGRSPLGPVDGWSPALISTVRLMLSSKAEIVLFWGPQYCALYNETYVPTIGDKHPHALGRPACEGWAELWDDLGPLLRTVYEDGETVHAKDRPFYIERDGGRGEHVYFDISYSPCSKATDRSAASCASSAKPPSGCWRSGRCWPTAIVYGHWRGTLS